MESDSPAIADSRPATPRSELWLYAGAAASYVIVGFFRKEIFAWWWFGAAWFVAYVWLVPMLLNKLGLGSSEEEHVDEEAAGQ